MSSEGTNVHSAGVVLRDGTIGNHKTITICECGRGNLHAATRVFRQRHNRSLTLFVVDDADASHRNVVGMTLDIPIERPKSYIDSQRDYVFDGVMYMKRVEDVEESVEHLLKQMSGCDVYFEDQTIE